MSNKHLTRPPTEILLARLSILLDNVNSLYQTETSVVEEDVVTEYRNALDLFMKSLDGSITEPASRIQYGLPADPLAYNIFTNSIMRDMEALFLEISALDKLVTSGFNSILA